jgi:hypothetical protein
MAARPSRHRLLSDGRTVPAVPAVVPLPPPSSPVRQVLVPKRLMNKPDRRRLGRWLVDHLGRPDRLEGLWWGEDDGRGLVISFRDDEAFVLFSLTWGSWDGS